MAHSDVEDSFRRYHRDSDVLRENTELRGFFWYKNGNLEIYLKEWPHVPDYPITVLKFRRIFKLSGVIRYQLLAVYTEGKRRSKASREARIRNFEKELQHWTWLYQASKRFHGAIIDGFERGILLVTGYEKENS